MAPGAALPAKPVLSPSSSVLPKPSASAAHSVGTPKALRCGVVHRCKALFLFRCVNRRALRALSSASFPMPRPGTASINGRLGSEVEWRMAWGLGPLRHDSGDAVPPPVGLTCVAVFQAYHHSRHLPDGETEVLLAVFQACRVNCRPFFLSPCRRSLFCPFPSSRSSTTIPSCFGGWDEDTHHVWVIFHV